MDVRYHPSSRRRAYACGASGARSGATFIIGELASNQRTKFFQPCAVMLAEVQGVFGAASCAQAPQWHSASLPVPPSPGHKHGIAVLVVHEACCKQRRQRSANAAEAPIYTVRYGVVVRPHPGVGLCKATQMGA